MEEKEENNSTVSFDSGLTGRTNNDIFKKDGMNESEKTEKRRLKQIEGPAKNEEGAKNAKRKKRVKPKKTDLDAPSEKRKSSSVERAASERLSLLPNVRISAASGARVVLVASGKGGTGKSTVTGNLAAAVGRLGYGVVVVDADTGLRSMDYILGAERLVFNASDVFDGVCAPSRALANTVGGVKLLAASTSGRQDDIEPEAFVALVETLCESFDFVFIDCPPGFEKGFKAAVCAATEGLLVVASENTSLRNASMAADVLAEAKIPFVVVGNRTGKNTDGPSPSDIAELLSAPLLGEIPESPFLTPKESKNARRKKLKAEHRLFSKGTPGYDAFESLCAAFVEIHAVEKKNVSDDLKKRVVESIQSSHAKNPVNGNADEVEINGPANASSPEGCSAETDDVPEVVVGLVRVSGRIQTHAKKTSSEQSVSPVHLKISSAPGSGEVPSSEQNAPGTQEKINIGKSEKTTLKPEDAGDFPSAYQSAVDEKTNTPKEVVVREIHLSTRGSTSNRFDRATGRSSDLKCENRTRDNGMDIKSREGGLFYSLFGFAERFGRALGAAKKEFSRRK